MAGKDFKFQTGSKIQDPRITLRNPACPELVEGRCGLKLATYSFA